jgi:hypothetical protein
MIESNVTRIALIGDPFARPSGVLASAGGAGPVRAAGRPARPLVRPRRRPVAPPESSSTGVRCHHAAADRSAGAGRPALRRRRVVAVVVLVLLAAAVLVAAGLLTGFGGDPASASGAPSARSARTLIAQPGDTLWDIAVEHHADIDVARYVDALVDENGGASIRAGQTIRLP